MAATYHRPCADLRTVRRVSLSKDILLAIKDLMYDEKKRSSLQQETKSHFKAIEPSRRRGFQTVSTHTPINESPSISHSSQSCAQLRREREPASPVSLVRSVQSAQSDLHATRSHHHHKRQFFYGSIPGGRQLASIIGKRRNQVSGNRRGEGDLEASPRKAEDEVQMRRGFMHSRSTTFTTSLVALVCLSPIVLTRCHRAERVMHRTVEAQNKRARANGLPSHHCLSLQVPSSKPSPTQRPPFTIPMSLILAQRQDISNEEGPDIISNSRVRRANKPPAAAAPPDTPPSPQPTNSVLESTYSPLAGALDDVRPAHPNKGSARVERAMARVNNHPSRYM
ncbi:hypothetical protein CPC08DRAFT_729299 [Agrocybe pediades]|nr:hypothetical protein CPC08DRAFT_729299 [Agrocybe pediades]